MLTLSPRVVTAALEVKRTDKTIGASLEAAPVVHVEHPVEGALARQAKRFAHLRAEQQAHRWERFSAGELAGQLTPELLAIESPPMADWLEAFVPLRVHVLVRRGEEHECEPPLLILSAPHFT